MNLSAAEQRVLRAALREFAATHGSDFSTLRAYHPFLHVEDAEVDVDELGQELGVTLEQTANE